MRHPCKFQCVSRLGSVTARQSSSGHQPNFAALNIGRHLYSAGRPSRWAFAHILVCFYFGSGRHSVSAGKTQRSFQTFFFRNICQPDSCLCQLPPPPDAAVTSRLRSVTARQSNSGHQPNFVALNIGRNLLHAARCKYRTQKSRQKSPSGHHRTTSSGYIFANKACVDNRKKTC